MPIFGGKRSRMDGLTRDEEKRRDALNDEVMRRAGGETGSAGQANAALAVLRDQAEAEPEELLWHLLLGRQLASMGRYGPAILAFEEAIKRDENDIRGYFAAGHAYFQASEAMQRMGAAATEDMAPAGFTVDNLHQEALRNFRRAQTLADRREHAELGSAVSTIEKAVARKAGRL